MPHRYSRVVCLGVLLISFEACNERAELNKRHAQGESDSQIDGIYRKPEEFTISYSTNKVHRIDCAVLKERDVPKNTAYCYRVPVPENVISAYAKVVERILAKKELAYEYVGYLGGPVREGIDDGVETIEENTIWFAPGNDEEKSKKCLQIRDSLVGFISRLRWRKMKGEEHHGDTDEDLSPVASPEDKLKDDHPLQPGQKRLSVEYVNLLWMKFNNIFRVYPIDQFSRADAYKFTSDVAVQAGISHLVEGDKFKIRAGRSLAVNLCEGEKPQVEDGGVIFYVEHLPAS